MSRCLLKVIDPKEQQAETYRYWQGRPDYERMEAIAAIVRDAYFMKGIDIDAQRSERTLVRIQRA